MLDVALLQLWYFRSPSWFLHFVFDHLFLKSHCHFSGPFRMLNFTALPSLSAVWRRSHYHLPDPLKFFPSRRPATIKAELSHFMNLSFFRFFSPFVWGKPFLHKRNPCTNVIITEHIRLHMKKKKKRKKKIVL